MLAALISSRALCFLSTWGAVRLDKKIYYFSCRSKILASHAHLLRWCSWHYLRIIQLNLRDRDNLRTKDKRPVLKVSFVWRFDCTKILQNPLSLLSCVETKKTTQAFWEMLLSIVKKHHYHQKRLNAQNVLQCSKPVAKCTLHWSVKVTCSSVWLCLIDKLLPETCS